MRRFLPTVGAVVLFVVLAAVGWGLRVHDRHATASRHELCVQIERIKATIRLTIRRSDTTLPTLAYYKAHPAELQKALDANDQVLRTFAQRAC